MAIEYQPVQPAEDFFKDLAEKEKLESKKYPSLPLLFSLMLNKIYAGLLKFVENVIGVRLYSTIDEPELVGISPRIKRLTASFIQKKFIKKISKTPRFYPDEPWLEQYQI